MVIRIRPEKAWTFEEKLAIIAVGSSNTLAEAVKATKLSRAQLLKDLVSALRKLPGTDLEMPLDTYARLWWRGATHAVWTGYELDGREVRTITATIWHDDYEDLRTRHRLAKGDPVPQIEATRAQENLS